MVVFSSSATVYGDPASVPVTESFPTGATNPYGSSKLFNEQILTDVAKADERWNVRDAACHCHCRLYMHHKQRTTRARPLAALATERRCRWPRTRRWCHRG